MACVNPGGSGSGKRSFSANRNEPVRVGALRRMLIEIEDQQRDGPGGSVNHSCAPGQGDGMEVCETSAVGKHGVVESGVVDKMLGLAGYVGEVRKDVAHRASQRMVSRAKELKTGRPRAEDLVVWFVPPSLSICSIEGAA